MSARTARRIQLAALLATMLAPAALPGAAAAATLRLAHASSDDSLVNQAALRFQKSVRARTGGALEIAVFSNGQLGDEDTIVERVGTGSTSCRRPSCSGTRRPSTASSTDPSDGRSWASGRTAAMSCSGRWTRASASSPPCRRRSRRRPTSSASISARRPIR